MGGRAAEALIFAEVSTGAADDLAKASEIARDMASRFGMADETGQVVYQQERQAFLGKQHTLGQPRDYAEATAREIDLAVRQLVDEAYALAHTTLTERRGDLEAGAALLLERETLTATEFPPMASSPSAASS